ncbi:hypothetical protein CHS0354_027986 [Potamilus streckersoni]|uniref:Uncharacterized protein n=1 Tax=Potamilus streckersoni TaxID=2493646 RepID=A0AAE0T4A9_9BIVA|nr:hypothetical protein CHS0354_027986 [Potamilus streckersoni]
MATLAWIPLDTDIGQHIVCVDVEDTNGMDSSDQRCFMIEVRTSDSIAVPERNNSYLSHLKRFGESEAKVLDKIAEGLYFLL